MTNPGSTPPTADAALGAADYRQLFYGFNQGFCVFEVLLDDTWRRRAWPARRQKRVVVTPCRA